MEKDRGKRRRREWIRKGCIKGSDVEPKKQREEVE